MVSPRYRKLMVSSRNIRILSSKANMASNHNPTDSPHSNNTANRQPIRLMLVALAIDFFSQNCCLSFSSPEQTSDTCKAIEAILTW